MVMPSSGCIGLYNCIEGISCSSINDVAVGLSQPLCLTEAYKQSGLWKGTINYLPVSMSDFYGYGYDIAGIPNRVTFSSSGGIELISVRTAVNNSWIATTEDSWISISDGSGTGNGMFEINVLAYSFDRSGNIVIRDPSPSNNYSVTISINQLS